MTKVKYFLLTLIVLALAMDTFGSQPDHIIEYEDSSILEIGNYLLILKDNSNKLSIREVINRNDFFNSTNKIPNLGISDATFWVKFKIKNNTKLKLVLAVDYPVIDEIQLFEVGDSSYRTTAILSEAKTFSNRIYDHQNYIFNLNVPPSKIQTFYLRIKSGEQIQLPISIGSAQHILEKLLFKDLLAGIYFGVILVMIFYNLFIFISVKDSNYLYYVFYIFFVGLTQASLQGYTFKYIWPSSSWLAVHSTFFSPCLVGIAALLFIRKFLHTKHYVPSLDKGMNFIIAFYLLSMLLSFVGIYNVSQILIQITAICASIYALVIAYIINKKGLRTARFFLIAWSIFLLGVLIFVLKDFGVLPYNNFTAYTMQAGSAIEVILLSFALADRINILKKEKEESQAEALKALKENERIIVEQNILLETKVKERTMELQEANEELNVTLTDLKDTQSKLVESEKMASLGQLTAGIAHEINNPINFVSSSVTPLKRDIKFLMELLDKYNAVSIHPDIQDKFKEVRQLETKLDLPYLKEEINTILKGITDGASRTSDIVKGLKNFSRLDESDLKKADINLGLDSTLILLNNKLDNIRLTKNYGNISVIDCYAGKVNQVFMNLISNSIHALQHKKTPEKGEIVITTSESETLVIISIKDNGTGIPDEIKNKIFDPFFTTKEVGEGTGLGLSIVYNIIQSHKGEIIVNSKVDVGTEFIITLPKSQKV